MSRLFSARICVSAILIYSAACTTVPTPVSVYTPDYQFYMGPVVQTFRVNVPGDFVDSNPGDGTCLGMNPSGRQRCSLRAAVMEANASPGHDRILLEPRRHLLTRASDPKVSESYEEPDAVNATVGDLDVTGHLTIEGTAGDSVSVTDFLVWGDDATQNFRDDPSDASFARIDATGVDRVIQVSSGAILQLQRIMLTGGSTSRGGGGVLNDGALRLERVAIVGNEAKSSSQRNYGGGAIQNSSNLLIYDTLLARNTVGNLNPSGGAIYNSGRANIHRSLIANNSARFGGAIRNSASANVENVTFYGNTSSTARLLGVISNTGSGETRVKFTTFASNGTARGDYLLDNGGGRLVLANSLFVDNLLTECRGEISTLGGNVMQSPCALTGTPSVPDLVISPQSASPVPTRRSLVDLGGFTPVYPFDRPAEGSSYPDITERAPILPRVDRGTIWRLSFDQRGPGFPRSLDPSGAPGGNPDPGAYEYSP